MDLNSISKKLLFISKLNNFNNNNLMKCEKVFRLIRLIWLSLVKKSNFCETNY